MKTKTCSKCRTPKLLDQFGQNKAKKDGLQSWCKDCKKARDHAYYKANPTRKKNVRATNTQARVERQRQMFEYLSTQGCVDCGETDPVVLEFDHVRGTKAGNIAKMVNDRVSWSRILDEIAKCEVRCCKCHRRKTAREGNHYLYRMYRMSQ